jgi:hypothetical protein
VPAAPAAYELAMPNARAAAVMAASMVVFMAASLLELFVP